MTTAELITVLIGTGGIGALMKVGADGLRAWRTGHAQAERNRNRTLMDRVVAAERRADDAECDADAEAAYRRIIQEYASQLRRLLMECGTPAERIPEWPERPGVRARD